MCCQKDLSSQIVQVLTTMKDNLWDIRKKIKIEIINLGGNWKKLIYQIVQNINC